MLSPNPVPSKNNPYRQNSSRTPVRPTSVSTNQSPRRSRKKFFLAVLVVILVAGATLIITELNNLRGIVVSHQGASSSSLLAYEPGNSALDMSQFKQVGDGRFNLLILGYGGEGHDGAYLTDTIQVASLDTIHKSMTFTSVPRDLYVKIPNYGYSKINATYEVGEQQEAGYGGVLTRQVVGQVLGIKISNFIALDFSAAKELVDTVGGIDVNTKVISDPFYPADQGNGYNPFYISAGNHHLNGTTALKYARSRETTSDFDRASRQQQIIAAIKAKTLTAGTLANPAKVLGILSTLGQHVRTDLQTDDIKNLIGHYRDIDTSHTTNYVLDTTTKLGLLDSVTDPSAGYISYPILGYGNYTDIVRWFQKNSPDPFIVDEKPTITVVNGAYATNKQLQDLIANLTDYGYTITLAASTVKLDQKYTTSQLYDTTNSKKVFSSLYLGSLYNLTIQKNSSLNLGTDFEFIYVPSTTKKTSS